MLCVAIFGYLHKSKVCGILKNAIYVFGVAVFWYLNKNNEFDILIKAKCLVWQSSDILIKQDYSLIWQLSENLIRIYGVWCG